MNQTVHFHVRHSNLIAFVTLVPHHGKRRHRYWTLQMEKIECFWTLFDHSLELEVIRIFQSTPSNGNSFFLVRQLNIQSKHLANQNAGPIDHTEFPRCRTINRFREAQFIGVANCESRVMLHETVAFQLILVCLFLETIHKGKPWVLGDANTKTPNWVRFLDDSGIIRAQVVVANAWLSERTEHVPCCNLLVLVSVGSCQIQSSPMVSGDMKRVKQEARGRTDSIRECWSRSMFGSG